MEDFEKLRYSHRPNPKPRRRKVRAIPYLQDRATQSQIISSRLHELRQEIEQSIQEADFAIRGGDADASQLASYLLDPRTTRATSFPPPSLSTAHKRRPESLLSQLHLSQLNLSSSSTSTANPFEMNGMNNAVFTWGAGIPPNTTPDEAPKCPKRKSSKELILHASTGSGAKDLCLHNAAWATTDTAKSAVRKPARKRSSKHLTEDILAKQGVGGEQVNQEEDDVQKMQNARWETFGRPKKRRSRECLRSKERSTAPSFCGKNESWELPRLASMPVVKGSLADIFLHHGNWTVSKKDGDR